MLAGYAVTKNEWVLKALNRFNVDVINLAGQDLHYLIDRVGQAPSKTGDADVTAAHIRFVSANALTGSPSGVSIRPYIVAAVPDRESPAKHQIRIAFVGMSDEPKQPIAGIKVNDPVETALQTVPQARRASDLVVVLAHVSSDVANRIAREVPGVDAVIAGNGREFTMPVTVAGVPVVFTPYETRMLGELRFYRGTNGRYAIKNRFIGLDSAVAEDPQALAFVDQSREAVKKEVERFTKPLEIGSSSPHEKTAGVRDSGYVSAQTCLQCHRAEFVTWSNTAHARAINSLATRAAELDSGCLACHTTGFNRGGFQNIAETRTLINVQCEECHGPGRAHVAKPDKTYGQIADLQAVCSRCHTAETSAEFDLAAFWARIKH